MLSIARLVKCLSLAALCVLMSVCSASAEQVGSVLPSSGLVEELAPIGLYTKFDGRKVASGPEDTIWFFCEPDNFEGPPIIGRMTRAGLINAAFQVPSLATSQYLIYEPAGLAPGLRGGMWFTVRVTGATSFIGRVTPGGKFSQFPLASENADPAAIVGSPDGGAWFIELDGDKIVRIDEAGTIVSEYTIPVGEPKGIAVAADGSPWFTIDGASPEGQSFVGHINGSGTVAEFPIPALGSSPAGIALGPERDMWFTEPGVGKIGRVTPEGLIAEFAAPTVEGPIGLGPDGNMWFLENTGEENALGRITPAGMLTSFSPIVPGNSLAMAPGADGEIWLAGWNAMYRFTIPYVPADITPPAVLGAPVEGQTLSATEGTWSNARSFADQWQVCGTSGEGCSDLPGEVAATHVMTAGDVGHTLRVVVSASGAGGSASAVSAVSKIVQAPPPPPPVKHPIVQEPLPIVGATMTWRFGWSRTYAIMEALIVRMPTGAQLEVDCRGKGCPFRRKHVTTPTSSAPCRRRHCPRRRPPRGGTDLAGLFKGRRLSVGALVSVTVTKPGWVSKSFTFTVRADKPPRVRITCTTPGAAGPAGEC
jgi:virginiamycin B lyase